MKISYYWIVSEILEHRKYAEVRPSLTQQLVAFLKNLFLFFFVKYNIISLRNSSQFANLPGIS